MILQNNLRYNRIKSIMPWIIVMEFKGEEFIGFKEIDID